MSATNQEVRLDEEDAKAKVTEEKQEFKSDLKEDINNTGNVSVSIALRNAIITPPNGPVCPKGMVLGADGVCRDPF